MYIEGANISMYTTIVVHIYGGHGVGIQGTPGFCGIEGGLCVMISLPYLYREIEAPCYRVCGGQ